MEQMKKLPDSEFDIMKVVWANEPPVTTNIIMEPNKKFNSCVIKKAASFLESSLLIMLLNHN